MEEFDVPGDSTDRPAGPIAADLKFLSYVDRWSVRPGESFKLFASTDARRFTAQLVRLTRGGPRAGDEPDAFAYEAIGEEIDLAGCRHELTGGSCVVVPTDGSPLGSAGGVTVQAWIWPTLPDLERTQAIIGWNGFAFGIRGGRLTVEVDGKRFSAPAPLHDRRWYRVACSIDFSTAAVLLDQHPKRRFASETTETTWQGDLAMAAGNPSELTIGAAAAPIVQGVQRRPSDVFNGKIAALRLIDGAVSGSRLDSLDPYDSASLGEDRLIAAWNFARELSTIQVLDDGPGHLHGSTYNTPLRAVTGPTWNSEEFDFRVAPEQYDAIHFHDDDLDDCRWPVATEIEVPVDARSGAYACRLRADGEEDFVPVFVPPAKRAPKAKTAFLIPTFTYMAYSNFDTSWAPVEEFTGHTRLEAVEPTDLWVAEHHEVGLSLYDTHSDGSGIHHVTHLRPMVTIRPTYRWWMSGGGGWTFNGDMYLIDWLEAEGREYDVITDHDLHEEGIALLEDYSCVLTGMHPEYYSPVMLDAVDEYVHRRGGNLMYLGGNGFYWVTTTLPDRPHVLELRRSYAAIRSWQGRPGEDRHSSTGDQGGIWRHRGRAPQEIAGVGFISQGGGGSADYVRLPDSMDPKAAFIFEGVGPDEVIGNFGNNSGGAAGSELDHADFSLGTPPDALILATSSLRHNDNYLIVVEDLPLTMPEISGTTNPKVRADMVYFETASGGAVFTPGSIDWIASLSHNEYRNNVSTITGNVLSRFTGERSPASGETVVADGKATS
ncbi:MAG: N,N-dimethylformamidase [Actinobacteria bacterium]|nr:N,N-dimethylformamidase [Actinomycetota bacterium]